MYGTTLRRLAAPAARAPRLAPLLVAAALALATATGAAADAPPGRGPTGGPAPTPPRAPAAGDCAVLHVHLNGTQPPTQTCLAPAAAPGAAAAGVVTPATATFDWCDEALQLFQDSDFSGYRLCLTGNGTFVNLKDYGIGYWGNWDNRVSSYRTGRHCGVMWEHPDARGESFLYWPWTRRRSMQAGWNDRVSSISVQLCPA